jgi:uncharacterized DUF497 family protein
MFEFDPVKSAANAVKHGIDFEAAQVIWDDGKRINLGARIGPDSEARRFVVGEIDGKLWSAVVVSRGDNVRIISVRRARADERALYNSGGV